MSTAFITIFVFLIIAELVKGLSANGTPPILQRFSWQLDLAYVMWNAIAYIRAISLAALVLLLFLMAPNFPSSVTVFGPILFLLWAGIFWLFNFFWVGKHKFDELPNPQFAGAEENEIDLDAEVMGTALNDEAKAYPVNMVAYHHRIQDDISGHPIWITYCGMCRSGRIYDRLFEGEVLDFSLIGAITYNATFRDNQSRSWWRQETGEAVKGKHTGKALQDMFVEHMSLKDWLDKYPNTKILQYNHVYGSIYDGIAKIFNGDAWFPSWQMHKKLQLVAGIDVGGHARAYDRAQLKTKRVINDSLGALKVVIFCSEDGRSTLAYHRSVKERVLDFELSNDAFRDNQTGSTWNLFGHCESGELSGTQLEPIQVRQQNIRSWTTFHPTSTTYANT